MTDFVEYIPKRHGQKPDYWTPDTLTGLDNKNYVRQPNWAWIAGTTYYVPYEAVHGVPRLAPVDAAADAATRSGRPARRQHGACHKTVAKASRPCRLAVISLPQNREAFPQQPGEYLCLSPPLQDAPHTSALYHP